MSRTINVFSSSAGNDVVVAGNETYTISLIYSRENSGRLFVKADRDIDVASVFPAFMRYKSRGRNGKTLAYDDQGNEVERFIKSKWYAYRYDSQTPRRTLYDCASMLQLESYRPDLGIFEILGVYEDGSTDDVRSVIKENFSYGYDEDNDTYQIRVAGWSYATQDTPYIGINKCGIALVDKFGRLRSNVERMKIVLSYNEGDIYLYPSIDK